MPNRGFRVLEGFSGVRIPQRATRQAAGYDIESAMEDFTIYPGETVLVDTGLTAYMNPWEELQIRPRSGLAYKYGIIVLNSPGTIDADYEGNHIKVMLKNVSNKEFDVKKYDRIAQAVFSSFLHSDNDMPGGDRTGGFGSTGV